MESRQVIIRVDRRSVLGNPFFMLDESERDKVCNQYREYFWRNFRKPEIWAELCRLLSIAQQKPLTLACWCEPKRCHARVIKYCLEWMDMEKLSINTTDIPEPSITSSLAY
jgi:hypothetical protein